MNMSGNYRRIVENLDDETFESLLSECGCMGVGATSEDSEMLKQNLAKIHEYSGEMFGMCSGLTDVEEWIKDKIAKATQSIAEVKHYLEYKSSAYAVQQTGIAPHQPDMGQRLPGHERMSGDKLAVMSQHPTMTPPSAPVEQPASGGVVGVAAMVEPEDDYGEEEPEMDDYSDDVMTDDDDDQYSLRSTFGIQDEEY